MDAVTLELLPVDITPESVAATPESWSCTDCGVDTAPGMPCRADAARAPITYTVDDRFEVYTVRPFVWMKAGDPEGCLCIGCLERRIGRRLKRKDFLRDHPFNAMPATPRLRARRR